MGRYSSVEILNKILLPTNGRTYVRVRYIDDKTSNQHISILDLGLNDDSSLERVSRYLNNSYLFRSVSPRAVTIVNLNGEAGEVDHRFSIFSALEDLALGLYRKSNPSNNFHEGCYDVRLHYNNGYIQEVYLYDLIDVSNQHDSVGSAARYRIESGNTIYLLDKVEFELKRHGFFPEQGIHFTVCGGFITSLVLFEG